MPDSTQNGRNAGLLFIHALTSLHPGSGTALGVVDLPVQRERHTHWPNIPGSSIKGVLKDQARRHKEPDLDIAFGPDTRNSDKHAGALSITDARLLAFPVRSLRGVFAWTTCPAALTRFTRDAALAGLSGLPKVPEVLHDAAWVPSGAPLLVGSGEQMVLEEFEFKKSGDAGSWAKEIAAKGIADEETRKRFEKCLVILSDDDFTHFAKHATEVVARIGLEHETKTVKDGALFYQEFLPSDTLFYSVVLANDGRRAGEKRAAKDMLELVARLLPGRVIQVGGDETIGKGLCTMRLYTA